MDGPESASLDPAQRDLATIRAALAGDRRAGARLAERLAVVCRILCALNERRGGPLSREDLEDASQDVVLRIWEKLNQFQGVGSLEAWVYRFCTFELSNRVRSRARARRRTASHQEVEDPTTEPHADDLLISLDELEAALDELGPPNAEVIRAKHNEGLSFDECGVRFGASPNTIKTRYYRGLRWLRQRLAGRLKEAH